MPESTRAAGVVGAKRAYDEPDPTEGRRVPVDRLSPRGLKKQAAVDERLRDIASSTDDPTSSLKFLALGPPAMSVDQTHPRLPRLMSAVDVSSGVHAHPLRPPTEDTAGMEFSPTGWVAIYQTTPSNEVTVRPVEAWSDGRDALVVDEHMARLVVASNSADFVRLEKCSRVVSAVPAQPGWSLRIWEENEDHGSTFTVPIAGWIVDDAGNLTPVGGSNDSYLEALDSRQRTEILYPTPEHLGQLRTGM